MSDKEIPVIQYRLIKFCDEINLMFLVKVYHHITAEYDVKFSGEWMLEEVVIKERHDSFHVFINGIVERPLRHLSKIFFQDVGRHLFDSTA